MFQLGKKQRLSCVKKVEFGVYLAEHMMAKGQKADEVERVLLPNKQVPEGFDVGDSIEVFIYKDSKDRPIATVNEPLLTLGEVKKLRVAQTSKIGAFLNWGLEKDLFLPFKQQTKRLHDGDEVLVALYVDKSERLAATMKVYHYLQTDSPYKKDDEVTGTVYELSDRFGAYVAVDDLYKGMVSTHESWKDLKVGEEVTFRVAGVKEDGKLDLTRRKKAHAQMSEDGEKILAILVDKGGEIGIGDKSSPEEIREVFDMSKNEFRRAIGGLYKQKKIVIEKDGIRICK